MFDVVALGELLIDFTPYGVSEQGNILFERNPGGAPANVAVALAKLKNKTAFIGMVGNDEFGTFLKNVLEDNGVNTDGLKFNKEVNTTLAFVHLNNGDRNFSFYRNPGADMMISTEDIDFNIIKNSKIFHFGSLSLTDEPSKSAALAAVKYAKDNGIVISYDPNLRPPLWKSLEHAKEMITLGLNFADILKVSEEELEFITDTKDLKEGTDILFKKGIKLIFVTLGEKGCFYRYEGGFGLVEAYKVNAIDTTGAGDAFLGAVLHKISDKSLKQMTDMKKEEMEEIIKFANKAGALATTKKGAIPAMVTMEEIMRGI
ncbi:PfkB family carbohydrate kinase [Clostridium sp. SYSU_GA19001]|uniref:PfkB family carbohydrate kinase n=1 Tax=Clostridium caldaquaticum TaxID=2940653 RepID=UPI0020774CA1|nr:PfkB family carbohydrate kinase [Clostridium caldaquaticum]MCM8712089.1 PfkB family carbohydrate kinase [Clostridium caldaquaticum]